MSNSIKTARFQLSDGNSIPVSGLGTWNAKGDDVIRAVKHAIKSGARLIDTALVYGNEKEIGIALREILANPQEYDNVRREDLFIVTKLWNTYHRPDLVRKGVTESLANLGLDYVDGYLIHWPMGYVEDREMFPKDENGKFIYSEADFLDTWRAMAAVKREGLVRSIGLSNFNSKQIERIVQSDIQEKPSLIQLEVHPYMNNLRLVNFCRERGITTMSLSQFGSPASPLPRAQDYAQPLEDATLKAIGEKHGKQASNVILRWLLQHGVVSIPKSVTPSRIDQNAAHFDFELSEAEMAQVDSLDRKMRTANLNWVSDHKYWPFREEF